ncbi:hypothetical protein, partial [Klebsiella oxytoca]|uniref:hypothetical protein n=1 Tax=Klebsiella oxytoca TaxID=571 RepID=UPI0013D47FB8
PWPLSAIFLRLAAALVLVILAGLATPSAALAMSAGCTAVNAGGLNATNSKSKAVTAAFLQGEKITLTYSGLWDWLYLET